MNKTFSTIIGDLDCSPISPKEFCNTDCMHINYAIEDEKEYWIYASTNEGKGYYSEIVLDERMGWK